MCMLGGVGADGALDPNHGQCEIRVNALIVIQGAGSRDQA